MRSDDLAPLLMPGEGSGVGLRQGTILTWDPLDATNTVSVGGTVMENLAILNTNEALLLEPGAVVGILTAGPTWFILGRITVPGTPEAATALQMVSRRIQADRIAALGTRSANTYGDLTGGGVGPSVTVTVSGSGKALAFWSADHGDTGNWETWVQDGVSVAVSGATTVAASASFALGHSLAVPVSPAPDSAVFSFGNQAAGMHLFTGLNPGEHIFTLKYRSGSGQAIRFQEREIAVFAL